jgi:uncharacterized RDD family membrane protein YckC
MSSGVDVSQHDPTAPQFARFSRRLRGIVFDWILVVVVAFGALSVAVAVRVDNFSRALGILVVIALLLYEPVMVSLTGGTLGHYFANLRVVDDRHGGNVSFLKALARVVIKGALGWLSFIVITATRRSQALHDLWTRSTVQIRDPAKAMPHHFITERTELLDPNMPSRLRRVVVISGYLLLIFIAYILVLVGLVAAGVISPGCFYKSYCSMGEKYLEIGAGLTWIAISTIGIGLGWRGRLTGARRRS